MQSVTGSESNCSISNDVNHNNQEKTVATESSSSPDIATVKAPDSEESTSGSGGSAEMQQCQPIAEKQRSRESVKERLIKFQENFRLTVPPETEESPERQQQEEKALNPLAEEFVPRLKPQQQQLQDFSQAVPAHHQLLPALPPMSLPYQHQQQLHPTSVLYQQPYQQLAKHPATTATQFVYHQQQFFMQPSQQQFPLLHQQPILSPIAPAAGQQPAFIGAPGTTVYIWGPPGYANYSLMHPYQQQ
ncbi:hypothetical protein BOX15_Mlig005417g1 [Macrostomum lignano]|uniref:Uncharacterized protein n=1 Tax=Macrostomum lignano TaxID=282301 RepID=A0A267DX53_9PLAT|nr:hypothetical protein BOX15_Mlig005417g1 [Macrostomum lignano]